MAARTPLDAKTRSRAEVRPFEAFVFVVSLPPGFLGGGMPRVGENPPPVRAPHERRPPFSLRPADRERLDVVKPLTVEDVLDTFRGDGSCIHRCVCEDTMPVEGGGWGRQPSTLTPLTLQSSNTTQK